MATVSLVSPDTPWFWKLLDGAKRNLQSLCHQLEILPREHLKNFYLQFDQLKRKVNPYFREELWQYFDDERSEDSADDFSAWVVMQGRAFFEEVQGNRLLLGAIWRYSMRLSTAPIIWNGNGISM